ncbi:helix-turn-helix transcriptional regulator [Streptococcus pseudoporcinus]|uniref:DNA-binding protein n=2 Tax=Streptococcus pseudoporcinus TaxID=361101 RepID=A0A4U9XKU3_9STRE|nr:helix-turn-helix transcriptional regulator [Streptococcus pseudoporcinus]EFR43661.1 DNA-binding helix-turn-helix protein [Streptococcus pseudoporcinus SPIN 20026]EHI65430.1 DNA-binding helix-turn-helix protein [Streptococcus pseudoporcinus LQ 940-04]VEF93747.1 DNA-binding protein [Streptococcus pseudoporcinus]VTS12343.1 DNA-binding protein [Streptococcus pseudoporcinus]VTS13462.1 DNA-binding protein [Streptococcus pseudoporcinus]
MKNKLQELRKAKKLSQAELADAMSVTRQTIISLEKGRYNASLELAFKLARYFHLTIEDVFYFEESGEEE